MLDYKNEGVALPPQGVASMMRAYFYARCSNEEQKDGRTLKRQESAVRAYCQRHELDLDDCHFIDLVETRCRSFLLRSGCE